MGDLHAAKLRSLVLLCAEDDEVDLVLVVQTAREHGFAPEVIPLSDIEESFGVLYEAFRHGRDSLFVACSTPNLLAEQRIAIRDLFAASRNPPHHLIELQLDASAPRAFFELLLQHLGGSADQETRHDPHSSGPHRSSFERAVAPRPALASPAPEAALEPDEQTLRLAASSAPHATVKPTPLPIEMAEGPRLADLEPEPSAMRSEQKRKSRWLWPLVATLVVGAGVAVIGSDYEALYQRIAASDAEDTRTVAVAAADDELSGLPRPDGNDAKPDDERHHGESASDDVAPQGDTSEDLPMGTDGSVSDDVSEDDDSSSSGDNPDALEAAVDSPDEQDPDDTTEANAAGDINPSAPPKVPSKSKTRTKTRQRSTSSATQPAATPSSSSPPPAPRPHETERCTKVRQSADAAHLSRDWKGVLAIVDKNRECWADSRHLRKLRTRSLMELGRFPECAREGRRHPDPQVRQWVALCNARK